MQLKNEEHLYQVDYLKLSENTLTESLFHNTNEGIAFISIRGIILKSNDAFNTLLQYNKEELNQTSFFDFLGDSSKDEFKEMLGYISKKNGVINKSLILIDRDTKKTVYEAKLNSVKTGLKGFGMVAFKPSFSADQINGRSKFSDLFLAISENLSEGIYRNSPESGMIYVNHSFARLFGFQTIKEILKLKPGSFYANYEDRKRIAILLAEQGKLVNESILFKRKNDTTFWGLVNCSVTKEFNGNVYYDGAIVDISEQKIAEDLLQQKNKELKKINAQMDRFLYSAYHDIRSPIASVLGLTNILRMELLDQRYITYLDKIDESLNKLDYFVNDVKNFSQNARQRIESKRIDFHELINVTWRKFQTSHDKLDLSIKVEEGILFFSDYTRLGLIFENIFKNSLQFRDKNKTHNFAKVNVRMTSEKAFIEIVDNGIGIGKSHLEKVFNMFYRATETSKGAGLGLYIAKETVLKLEGSITIESELGLGTIVNIEIPNDQKGKLISRKLMMLRD